MNLVGMLAQLRRTEVQWTLVPALAAIGLLFVPGFNVLSFYFCLPMALLLAMAAGSVTITRTFRGRATGDTAAGLRHGLIHSALLGLPPLVVITAGHFINGPCDYAYGLSHFMAGPFLSTMIGAGVAASCSILSRKESTASRAFISIFVLSFVPAIAILYFTPAVNFFNPFLGMYPGPIYDEIIEITPAYLTFRLWCLIAVATFWTFARAVRPGEPGMRDGSRAARVLVPFGLLILCAITLHGWEDFRFVITRADIRHELSFVRSDRWCVIHADASYAARDGLADDILKDCGFRHRQTAEFFGVEPNPPVTVFLYRDASQKARLMGARHVEISKPWMNEIHVTGILPGDMILAHEIAHVTAGRMSPNLLAMPVRFLVVPDMALVEGLAVAGAFADDGPSPHEWALAMLRSGMTPDLETLFAPLSFITSGAAASYNTAGSFLHYVRQTHGMPAISALAQGRSFFQATGLELGELQTAWVDFLTDRHGAAMDDVLKMRATARFSDPGVLNRRCPLDVARRLRDAARLYDLGCAEEALDKVRQAVELDPMDRPLRRLAARMEFGLARGLGEHPRFERMIEDILRPPNGAATMADRTAAADLLILRGINDIDRDRGNADIQRAFVELRDLKAMLTPGGAMRGVCARLAAIHARPRAAAAIIEALSDPRPWAEGDAGRLFWAAAEERDEAILWYLAGRAASREGLPVAAADAFRKALDAGFREPLPDYVDEDEKCVPDFMAETLKLLGTAAYWAGNFDVATDALSKALEAVRFQGDRMVIQEYLERIRLDTDR